MIKLTKKYTKEYNFSAEKPVFSLEINDKFGGTLIVTETSGYGWLPPEDMDGYLTAEILLEIGDKLKELNGSMVLTVSTTDS